MGKFGRRVEVNTDLSSYMIGVMAPSGFGKSTLMYETCEKEFGPDGYIILDMSTENGTAALQGAVAEVVPTWKKMKEVVDDIVENKDSDYPDLKVVIIDTLDAAFDAAETYCVAAWNKANLGKQGFTPATSINSVEGGFGRGMDKVVETVRKEIVRLQKVGVGVWWCSHIKEKEVSDLFTGITYTTLTANMPLKYFSSIKNSTHIVAFGYFDRNIEKQEIGDANPVTKKKRERKAILDESRKLKFRDDAFIADAKSRFTNIIDEIVLDSDKFISAIKDAILAQKSVPYDSATTHAEPVVNNITDCDEDDTDFNVAEHLPAIRAAFRTADDDTKAKVKAILTNNGGKLSNDMNPDDVMTIESILEI